MAIYKPTDCSPFNGTFDISKNSADLPIIFECKIDTSNSPVTGYSIEIYDSNNSLIFPPTSREQGPVKNNVTYLSDLRPYVTTNFSSFLPNLKNINSGLNGSYLEIPFYVEAIDTTENSTVSRNQMSANSTPKLVEGQTYTWKITLYQEVKKGNNVSATIDNSAFPPDDEKYYDMTVTSGTVIGSNEKRIQTALIDSDDKVVDNLVLLDKFIQPIQISELGGYDPTNQKTNPVTSWTGAVPTTFTMTRSLITGYDSTYGYIYPSTAEGNAFADGQIVPENANGFQIFKNGNNPSNLGATDMVEFIYDSGEFNGKMTWKTSAAKSEQSYWEQIYSVDSDPNGVFYPLKGDGYSSFALTGSERIIFNNIQDPKVQYGGIYYGSPYNGIFEPHFSSKKALNNNIIVAGTYTFKQNPSMKNDTIEQELDFVTINLGSRTVFNNNKIKINSTGISYNNKASDRYHRVYFDNKWFFDYERTITIESDQEVSSDFFKWFSENINTTPYQVTVVWNRTSDAANWGTLSNKIIYCRRDGKNYEINTTTQVGEINKTPFKFVEEKPIRIFNTATAETQNQITGDDSESNPRIFHTSKAISSILSVTNNNGVDITKDCAFEVGNDYIIYTSGSAIPSDLTISVKYIPFNIQDYTGIIFYNKRATTNSDAGIIYIRPSININKNMIFKEVTTTANPTWFNINYFNKDYNYITYTGNTGFNPEIDKTRYQIKSFYKDSDYNPFSIYKNPEIVSTISGNVINSDGVTNAITTRNFTVTSTYSQNSYIQWKSYQWILYDSAKRTVLEKTDEKYDGEITATFYGLDPQKYYILSLILQTNTGKIVEIDYVIYSDFTETAEQRDLVDAEFDCDTLSMRSSLKLVNTVLAPNADEYLSNGTDPKEDTVYYYNKDLDFYQKKSKLGYYETAASIKDGVLTINGQNSLDYNKMFKNYAINSNTRTGSIQTSAEEVVLEGVFMFSDDYVGDVFSISRDDNSNATVSISIPKVLEEVDNDGFVNLSNDANKLKIKNGSYLKVIDENGILSNTWQDSEKYHNTSVWKKSMVAPTGDRINVANFKYAEVKNSGGTYNKDTYLNIAGPYNSYDETKPLKNPMNPKEQTFSFISSDGKDISGMCSDGPFYINQPDRLIWLDYKPWETQMEVVQDTDENGIPVVDKQTVCVETPLSWDDDSVWKDGIYVTKGLEKTLIGQVFVNGTVVKSDYLEKSGVKYSNSGLTKQIQVAQNITERKSIANYEFAFKVFINTNNFSVDQLRSRCYVKAALPKLSTPQNVTVNGNILSFDSVENAEKYEIFAGTISIGETAGISVSQDGTTLTIYNAPAKQSGTEVTIE